MHCAESLSVLLRAFCCQVCILLRFVVSDVNSYIKLGRVGVGVGRPFDPAFTLNNLRGTLLD